MNARQIPLDRRPDLMDLIGPEYDVSAEKPADRTLIICSAPRTGSYELCRFLLAAGVGIPHEYFHPQFVEILQKRWDLPEKILDTEIADIYLQLLKHQRVQNGVFALNMQYWHYSENLQNKTGAKLFNNAVVIHLFRPDILNQTVSWRIAMNTGVWDFSGRRTAEPRPYPVTTKENIELFASDLDFVTGEDAGFRKLFAMAEIEPIFITTPQLFQNPKAIVCELARLMGVDANIPALDAMIANSKPYQPGEEERKKAYGELGIGLKQIAFNL